MPQIIHSKKGFENFPMTIDSWKGRHVYIDPEMVAVTQSQAHLNAEYSNPEQGHGLLVDCIL